MSMVAGRSGSVQAALARAQRHAGTAAVAAVLTPLAMAGLTSPAQAVVTQAPLTNVTISGATATVGGVTTFTYTVTNNVTAGTNPEMDAFEIPELAAGDFNVASFTGPEGWSARLEQTATQSGTGLKNGTLPGAYILVSTVAGLGIGAGSSGYFTLSTTESGTLAANFGVTVDSYAFGNGYSPLETGYVDPPVPGGASVPEPATLAILGGAAMVAATMRARRKG